MESAHVQKELGRAAAMFILLCGNAALKSDAANVTVIVGGIGNVFIPATTNVSVGDQVTWQWAGNNHTSTSGTTSATTTFPNGLWDSGLANSGNIFAYTFNTNGTFPYYCANHFNKGMKGSITVNAAPSVPPSVSITNPVASRMFLAPAAVTIRASASDPNAGGAVTNVQFLVDSNVLANISAPPFWASTSGLTAGSYTLAAIATDSLGLKATNSVAIQVVMPVPVAIATPEFSSGAFQFSYSANVGFAYIIQASPSLSPANWQTVATNAATTNPMVFTDTNSAGGGVYYRVGRVETP